MTDDELLRIIEQAAEEGWTSLNLSNEGLTKLPPEIGMLTKLVKLRLKHNQLTELPPEIGMLTNLSVLHLTRNQISVFPNEIEKLENLTQLYLNYNNFVMFPREIKTLSNLIKLSLSNNKLTVLPPEIGELTNLDDLDLSKNKLTALPPAIGHMMNLGVLYLMDNQLTMLPQEIGKLANLKWLYLTYNRLTALPQEIKRLTNLKKLSLRGNPLPIPPEIMLLTDKPLEIITYYLQHQTEPFITDPSAEKNEWLDRSNRALTTLPIEITYQTSVKRLSLEGNLLAALPPEVEKLINLIMLNLSGNQFTMFPSEIGKLRNLVRLYMAENQLTALSPEIRQLTKLRQIDLGGNQLSTFPQEIRNLKNLENLFVGGNKFTTFPTEITTLSNLKLLSFKGNKLTKIPSDVQKLTKLKELYLNNNELTALPPEIRNLTQLTVLDLRGNPLTIPSEILALVDQPQKILNYYFQHIEKQKKPLDEAKILIVGQGAVGKTSLIKRLLEDKFDPHEIKTDGIAIKHWLLMVDEIPIRLNLWDFGGQEIMHATHQFFLTKRSLYVLVLDSRVDEQENRLEYWLKIIQSFGGNSPVIVVCNKSDQHDLELDGKGLQIKYPIIRAFAKSVSCKTGEGIPKLKTLIEREVAQLEHIHDELILSWFAVKTKLEQLERDYISYSDYQQMCQEEEVNDDLSQQTLLGFLHDLGVVLHFHDHPLLEDTNVLNPEWVTRGVYQLLNSYELFQNKGELDRKTLERILDPQLYPRNKHQFIIDMMRKFELCFDFTEFPGKRFLIPDLLPKEEPYTGEWADSLAFQYHYNILPSSVVSRFMVRMHAYIYQRTYWRYGVVLISEDRKNRALVKADIEDKKNFIYVSGRAKTRYVFLEIIRADFHRVHKTIPKLAVKEKVPIPGYPQVVVDYKHLLTLEELGEETFIPEGLRKKVSVKDLLHGISGKGTPHGQSYGVGATQLSFALTQQIIEFLITIPNIHDKNAQQALVYSAGLDPQLQHQIDFATSAAQFIKGLIPVLVHYGQLQDGRYALTAILKTAENYFGQDKQAFCKMLIQKVQVEFGQSDALIS